MTTFSFAEYDPENPTSNEKAGPGKAVLQVIAVKENEGQYGPYLGVTFTVLAHDKQSEVGREYFQICPLSGKAAQGTQKLAMATGIVTLQMFADAKVDGTEIEIDFSEMEGEVVAGEIKANKDGKTKVWDWYPLDHPVVEKYPKFPAPDDTTF